MPVSRRSFLKKSTFAAGFTLTIPKSVTDLFTSKKKIKLGLITDLHAEIIHDASIRLEEFLKAVSQENPVARFQLGDFATPNPKFHSLIQRFNNAPGLAFHVLGNHDQDGGYTKSEVASHYGMPASYYSLDVEGIKVLVLDGNESGSPTHRGGYPSYIGMEQQQWLIHELQKADSPVLILSHQPIAGIYTIDNSEEIQGILSEFSGKILLAINGHAHVDQFLEVGGVRYLHLNSASYYWVGENLARQSFGSEIHDNFPALKNTCPYAEVLFSFLTIDPSKNEISLKGKKTRWVGPSPLELGYSILSKEEQLNYVNPQISNRRM